MVTEQVVIGGRGDSLISTRRYVMLEHMTDAFWEAYGTDLADLLANCAAALVDTVVDIQRVETLETDFIEVKGHDLESILYNWLDSIVSSIGINRRVYSKFEVQVFLNVNAEFALTAKIYGEQIDYEKHRYKTEVKGVTYHLMAVEKVDEGYRARFILDL